MDDMLEEAQKMLEENLKVLEELRELSKSMETYNDDDITLCHSCDGELEVIDPHYYCPHCGKF